MTMLFICGESPIFSLLLSDAQSYSNRILKQGTVMTLRCFSVNLQSVISIHSIDRRTNGPVNAHLSLLHIPINMFEYYGI